MWWLAALAWMGLIFWLSSSPDAQGAALRPPFDKLAHAVSFGLLALLFRFATHRALLSVLLASLYGLSDELHQAGVPGRDADVFDWVADTVGALLAVGAVWFLTRRRRERAEPLQ